MPNTDETNYQITDGARLVWVDIETFGLTPATDPILEVGVLITDLNLDVIDGKDWLLWEDPIYSARYEELTTGDWVYKTHKASGLFFSAEDEGLSLGDARLEIARFLQGHGVDNEPMCGSSVAFDRKFLEYWMPSVESVFHYRSIDVSTIKELCKRYNPQIYKHLPEKKESHRVWPDLKDTVNEFRFYRNNFLYI